MVLGYIVHALKWTEEMVRNGFYPTKMREIIRGKDKHKLLSYFIIYTKFFIIM